MNERTETMTQASAPRFAQEGSYADWSSIFAGAVVASAVAFVFTTFGAALGLSLVSPYEGDGSAIAAAVAVGTWMLWTTVSSFMTGGYIAGRMRRRVDNASADEVNIRDGIHGLAVWGAALLLGVLIFGSTVGGIGQFAADSADAVAQVAEETGAVSEAAAATEETAEDVSAEEAAAAAETARIYSVVSAFAVAASLLVAAAGAYWAAGMGGRHRDEGRAFARFGPWT